MPRPLVPLAVLLSVLAYPSSSARGMQSTGTWEVVPSPNTGSPHNALHGVAALSPSDVWAVGASGVFEVEGAKPVIQHWNGATWSLVATPEPDLRGQLLAISAVDAQDIWAVGGRDTGGQALIEHWDGRAWSLFSHPNPGTFNRFFGVAAVSRDDVWAVGQVSDGGLSKTLVEHWNGSSWSVVPSPNVPNQHNKLTGVTAVPGSSELWAVGEAGPSTLLLHWNGTQWSLVPGPHAGTVPHLTGVVALASDDVWAVGWTSGTSGTITLTMHWNGSTWSVVPSPNPGPTFNYLWGVGAAASNDVWAVGDSNEDGDGKTLLLRWNGTTWSQVDGDNTGPSGLGFSLNAVSALSGGDAWAVGTNSHALAEHWNGEQWSIVAAPNAGVGNNVMRAVSGSAGDDVWQVGYFVFGTEHRTLTQHWDGEAWSLVPSPNTGKRLNELHGVVAVSPTNAWAVGSAHSGDVLDETTLILHWDGESWKIVPSPNPGTAFNSLRAISANGPNDIWAVGGFGPQFGPFKVHIQHWNGVSWTVVPAPNMPATNNEFFGVAAVAPDDVWAVGYFGAFAFSPLIEHWDGSTWTIVPSPDNQLASIVLRAVAGSGANAAFAAGTSKNLITNFEGTITQNWDGKEWSTVPGVGGSFSSLWGIAAAAPDAAWEVGDSGGLALIGHWDGEAWSNAQIPVVEGRLLGATALSPCDVWAVGQRSGSEPGLVETLSMHFTQQDCDAVWTDVGHALAGVAGEPVLSGNGPLTPGSSGALTLTDAARSALSALFTSIGSAPVPFKGGTLAASPPALTLTLVTSQVGSIALNFSHWPAGLSGLELYFQYAIKDGAAVQGVALSNALEADIP